MRIGRILGTGIGAYATVLVAATLVLIAVSALSGRLGTVPIVPVIGLALVAYLAERQSIRVASATQMSVSVLPLLFAAVAFGPAAAMVVGALALLGDARAPYTRWVVWTCVRAISAGLAGLAASILPAPSSSFAMLLAAVALAASVEGVVDLILNAMTVAIRRSATFIETASAMFRLQIGTLPLYAPLIAALVYAYSELSPLTLALFFAPALAAQRLFVLYQEQRELADELVDANRSLERASLSFATALVATLEARDEYTAGHSAAVATYARDIAVRMGLSEAEQQLAHLCGLVHDVGKIGLPARLLEKPGPLTLAERRQMEAHSVIGERILAKVDNYAEISRIVRHHHERVDGRGYPDGLGRDEIPLISRIIAVADAYDAMTSDRPYRLAMPSRVARLRLAQAVESQFDTGVVAVFEAILAGSDEMYRTGTWESGSAAGVFVAPEAALAV